MGDTRLEEDTHVLLSSNGESGEGGELPSGVWSEVAAPKTFE